MIFQETTMCNICNITWCLWARDKTSIYMITNMEQRCGIIHLTGGMECIFIKRSGKDPPRRVPSDAIRVLVGSSLCIFEKMHLLVLALPSFDELLNFQIDFLGRSVQRKVTNTSDLSVQFPNFSYFCLNHSSYGIK